MGRPKKSETNTTSVVETVQEPEKTTEVETNTPVETEATEVVEESKPVETVQEPEKTETDKKPKKFKDDEKVIIKYEGLAGKKLSLPTRMVEFDDKGNCEVTGAEANRLLTIPGYKLAK